MTKKTIRIILAFTILMPVWVFVGGMLVIFPWPIFLILCPFYIAGYSLKLWVSDLTDRQRQECKKEIGECFAMMIAPLIASWFTARQFIDKGSLGL